MMPDVGVQIGMGAVVGAVLASPGAAQVLPSGKALSRIEVLRDVQPDGALWLRFRYHVPGLTHDDYARVQSDFQGLCESEVLPYVRAQAPEAVMAVISFASEPVAFGVKSAAVVQFFEAFSLADDHCQLEPF